MRTFLLVLLSVFCVTSYASSADFISVVCLANDTKWPVLLINSHLDSVGRIGDLYPAQAKILPKQTQCISIHRVLYVKKISTSPQNAEVFAYRAYGNSRTCSTMATDLVVYPQSCEVKSFDAISPSFQGSEVSCSRERIGGVTVGVATVTLKGTLNPGGFDVKPCTP